MPSTYAPAHETKVTYPGIGEYTYFGPLFPVKDLQGSIRGYVNKTGLKSAFGYRPYGTTIDLARYSSESDERWQGKTFDGEHGKYYFGARYYDSFFGMWMSPDPAGQFANPYSYGGDPLNYIDPTGMWAIGLGLVIGYDKSHGWSFGFGAAAEVGGFGVNASFSFNEDGSKSFNLSVNASIPVLNTGLWFDAGIGLNVNTYTGASFSRSGGVCYGASKEVACAGVEVGQGFSWDRSGGFNGMTVYAEAYVNFYGGADRLSVGGEVGFFGAESRGMYAGISALGLHAQVSQNGGLSWGFEEKLYYKMRNDGPDPKTQKPRKYVGLSIPTLGIFSDIVMYDHGNRNDNQKEVMGKNRKAFEKIATEKGMISGHYSAAASGLHENLGFFGTLGYYLRLLGSLVNLVDPPKRTVDKMWMGKNSAFSFLYGIILFPSVEGLFYPGGEYASAPSYNYGNNIISHIFWDIFPGLILGYGPD